jgi:hypothetical protein
VGIDASSGASIEAGAALHQIAGIKNPESCDSGFSVFGARDGIELLAVGHIFTKV